MHKLAAVSVVVPCYRCTNTIERAVASVYAQTRRPSELILVDDHSNDGTLLLMIYIKTLYPEGWIKVIESRVNAGAATARNIGWAAATQPFIAFLDSDDSWHPQKIEIQYDWMRANPEAALTGHGFKQITRKTINSYIKVDYTGMRAEFGRITKSQILLSNRFHTPAVMLRRELPFRFKDGKRHGEDYLLWAELCCSGYQCYSWGIPLVYLYKAPYGEGGLSAQMWKMEKGELDTYWTLFKKRHFGWLRLSLLTGLSLAKYVRRLLLKLRAP